MPKKKDFTGDPGGLIGDAMFGVIKPIYKEAKRQERAARAPRKIYYKPTPKLPQKYIVFEVLPRAIRNAGSTFSGRDLYYATRPLAYAHHDWEPDKTLDFNYFSQTLLTEYQEQKGRIAGLWRDPRGHLHEPHTKKSIGLGTREVLSYEFPDYTFDKILYVEKEGEWPKLKAAKLAERYDMAIASAKGYPVEAVRELFSRAEGGDYQLFVFHDADLDGYNIACVMREATRRMPDYNVDVIDIGLTVEDALDMGLDPEPFSRKKDISWELQMSLSGVAREYLYNWSYRGVSGERFELNAILPDTSRIEYIERKLQENSVRGKVIPPDEKLKEMAEAKYRELSAEWVAEAIDELVSRNELDENIANKFVDEFELGESRGRIEARFEGDRSLSWREAIEDSLEDARKKHADAFKDAVREAVEDALTRPDPTG
jgi:polyhydroxyalkanoate synthesis regulator phasin